VLVSLKGLKAGRKNTKMTAFEPVPFPFALSENKEERNHACLQARFLNGIFIL
jgi:hypothetical protein